MSNFARPPARVFEFASRAHSGPIVARRILQTPRAKVDKMPFKRPLFFKMSVFSQNAPPRVFWQKFQEKGGGINFRFFSVAIGTQGDQIAC